MGNNLSSASSILNNVNNQGYYYKIKNNNQYIISDSTSSRFLNFDKSLKIYVYDKDNNPVKGAHVTFVTSTGDPFILNLKHNKTLITNHRGLVKNNIIINPNYVFIANLNSSIEPIYIIFTIYIDKTILTGMFTGFFQDSSP